MADGSRTITGGLHDIVHEKGDIDRIEKEDTSSTRDFKRALAIRRYLQGKGIPEDVRRYEELFKLTVKGPVSFELWSNAENEIKIMLRGRELLLPKGSYRIVRRYRKFLFFTMKEEEDFFLDKDMEV